MRGQYSLQFAAGFSGSLNQGADIIELDADNTLDGELFIQHPKMEKVHLRMQDRIRDYNSNIVENFRLSNSDLAPTEWCIPRLEDVLKMLKGKCIINIDKFWGNPKAISKLVRKLGMEDQVLIKTADKPQYLDAVEEYAPDLYFMTVARDVDKTYEQMATRNINYVGTEVLFDKEDAPVAGKEYIDMMHQKGKIV